MFKLRNHNIILPKYLEIVKKKGSSFVFSALGGRDKEKKENSAKKIAVGSEGVAEGGFGGIPPRPSEYKKRTAPPSCSLRAEPRKIVFFSF